MMIYSNLPITLDSGFKNYFCFSHHAVGGECSQMVKEQKNQSWR